MNLPQCPKGRSALGLLVIGAWLVFAPEISAQPYVTVPALRLTLVWRADANAPSAGYWVLQSLPRSEDVIATGALKQDLRTAIATVRAVDEKKPREWNLKKRDQANFSRELARQMPTYVDLEINPPHDPKLAPSVFELAVTYRAGTGNARPITRKPIEISIIVRGSAVIERQPVMTTIGNLAAHGVGNLGPLSAEERQTKVFVGVTDAVPANAVAWADSEDHAHAFRMAAFAFTSAKANNLAANQPFGEKSQETGALSGAEAPVISAIENEVIREFGLPGDWRPVPQQDEGLKLVQSDYGDAPWKIRIALQAVEEVTFRIRGSRVEGNIEPLEAHPRWASDIAALERDVQEHQQKNFSELRGRLLTNEEFLSHTKEIVPEVNREDKVVNAAVETGERTIVVTGDFLPRVTDLQAGVGYSTDKQISGSISLTTRNLLKDEDLLKLSATAGWEKQTGEFSYALPYFTSLDGRSSATLDINATYGKDNDLMLGAPQIGGFDEERLSGSIRNTFHFVKERLSEDGNIAPATPELRPGRIYSLMLAASAGLSDTRLSAPPALRAETERGQILFLLLDSQQNWRWKLRLRDEVGLGETRLLWNATAKKAFRFGPGDFDFFAAHTDVTGKVYFGSKSSRDFILRLTIGGAVVTGNSPIFEEFRIGGDTIVRGMEEGERTARGVFFDTVQFGVALERLWPGASQTLGFDLKNIYLSLLFDHALITRRGSNVPPDGESRNFETVGASVEMALPGDKVTGSLEFGYAWSPQSIHEHGRIFTTVRLDF